MLNKLFRKNIVYLSSGLFLITPFLLVQLPGHSQVEATPTNALSAQPNFSSQRQEIAENFLELLFNQQYEAATQYISPVVKSEFPAAVLRQKVESFEQRSGTFISRLESQVEGDIVTVDLLFERGERTFIVSFDENLNILNANNVLETSNLLPPLAMAQTDSSGAWLDGNINWNQAGATIPQAPESDDGSNLSDCAQTIRQATLPEDALVEAAGWSLAGSAQIYNGTTVITGMTNADGMCRPLNYQVFVFTNGEFSGTLSPVPMNSRTDGSVFDVNLYREGYISASFNRYAPEDPLCCASRESLIFYEVENQNGISVLVPQLPASTTPSRYAEQPPE